MTRSERGAQIREARQRQKLSTYRVAIRADIHPNSVWLAECGAASEEMIERIARVLGLPEQRP